MEIHFCDLCNESVPEADLDAGRAVRLRGRVICAVCERAMSGRPEAGDATAAPGASPAVGVGPDAAPAAAAGAGAGPERATGTGSNATRPHGSGVAPRPSAPRSAGGLFAFAFLSIVLVLFAGAGAAFYLRLETVREETRRVTAALREALTENARLVDARIDNRVNAVGVDVEDARRDVDEVRIRLDEAARHQRDALEAVRDELARLGEKAFAVERIEARLDVQERQLEQVFDTLAELHGELLRQSQVRAEAPPAEPFAEPVAELPAEPARPEWWPLVADLASPSSGKRWQAVQELGNTRDPLVVEHVAPMLRDADIFVRMAAARVLGDIRSQEGVPALIDALEDGEASVREAALVALRAVTGEDIAFDPVAKESERAKRVKAWRDWWKKAANG